MWMCVFFTLLQIAVVRRFGPSSCSSCHASRYIAEKITPIDALPGSKAHVGT